MTWLNVAVTDLSAVMFDNVQVPVELQSPDQPSNEKWAPGLAVNVRSSPSFTVNTQGEVPAVQVVVPSVTEPDPETVTVTA